MDTKKKTLAGLLGLLAVGGLAFLAWPRKVSAAPLTSGGEPATPEGPKNAQEAYGLAMNQSLKDADYVLKLAQYLNAEGSHPEWAAAAQRRYYDLKAEELLGDGLKLSTSLSRVLEISKVLQPTHNDYAIVLGQRISVQRGEQAPVAAFHLPLLSGGDLVVDMSIYAPAGGGGSSSPGVSPAGASSAQPPQFPTSASPAASPPAAPTAMPAATPSSAPAAVPPGTPPLAVEETKPENDPYGTIRLARLLLDEQSRKGWKYVSDAVKQWQSRVGLTADGKFGPGSAMRMAQEVAILPWIRYWSLGFPSKQAALDNYRGRLKAFALQIQPTQPEHATSLIISANKETAQGWPSTPAAAAGSEPTAQQVAAAISELNQLKVRRA